MCIEFHILLLLNDRAGHRGEPTFRWKRGLREPQSSVVGLGSVGLFSLFIDGISMAVQPNTLRKVFEKEGIVEDVYVSKKKRHGKQEAFGFVRFRYGSDAEKAIRFLNGFSVSGSKLKVSWARYNKNGRPFSSTSSRYRPKNSDFGGIKNPAFRDGRKYVDVLSAKKQKSTQVEAKLIPLSNPSLLFYRHGQRPVFN